MNKLGLLDAIDDRVEQVFLAAARGDEESARKRLESLRVMYEALYLWWLCRRLLLEGVGQVSPFEEVEP